MMLYETECHVKHKQISDFRDSFQHTRCISCFTDQKEIKNIAYRVYNLKARDTICKTLCLFNQPQQIRFQ